jgi:hypothetical protein
MTVLSRYPLKAKVFTDDLRGHKAARITCGEAHFKALAGIRGAPSCDSQK